MTDHTHLLHVMAIVAESLEQPADLAETRERLTFAARDAVVGADYASFTLRDARTGEVLTTAATDAFLYDVDKLQYELREGPCFDAVTDERFVVSEDLRSDPRWPSYGPRAADLGVGSQVAVRLRDDDLIGGLNLFAQQPGAFREPLDDVRLIAKQAGAILGYARSNDTLSKGLESRTVIGAAIGIVMERYSLSEEQAFQFLVRVSQTSNIKLREVAEGLVHPVPGPE